MTRAPSTYYPQPCDELLLKMDLESVLNRLKIQCYLHRLIDSGFDTWDAVKDIAEVDM